MTNIRRDVETGKLYTWNNIPIVDGQEAPFIQNNNGFFKIFSENTRRPEDSWYNGRFIGDNYAVFKWVQTTRETGYWHQVSNWYVRYSSALKKMQKLAKG